MSANCEHGTYIPRPEFPNETACLPNNNPDAIDAHNKAMMEAQRLRAEAEYAREHNEGNIYDSLDRIEALPAN